MYSGLEAISFQYNHRLTTGLVSLFKEAIEYKKQLDVAIPSAGLFDNKKRFSTFNETFKKIFVPRLKKVIEDSTNIIMQDIILNDSNEPAGFFAIEPILTKNDVEKIIPNIAGLKKPNDLEELVKYSKLFNETESKLNAKAIDKIGFKCNLFLDTSAAFFLNENYPTIDDLTAEEITGIILHEVGHAMGLIEHCGRSYYYGSMVIEQSKTIFNHTDMKNVDLTKMIETSTNLSDDVKKALVKNIDKLNKSIDSANKYTTIASLLLGLLKMILLAYVNLQLSEAIVGILLVAEPIFSIADKYSSISSKYSKDTVTSRNMVYFERIADEFVVRHGFGVHVGTALDKIYKLNRNFVPGSLMNPVLKESKILKALYVTLETLNEITECNISDNEHTYESTLNRLHRLAESTRAIFKDKDLPPEVRKYYLAQSDELEIMYRREKKRVVRTIDEVLWTYIVPLTAPKVITEILLDGRMTNDMKKLLDQLDAIMNTRLYVQAAQIKDMA